MIESDRINLLDKNEHIELLKNAGFKDIKVDTVQSKGWIVICGVK